MDQETTPNDGEYTLCALGNERHAADETYCMKHQCGTYKPKTHQNRSGQPMQGPVIDRQTF